MHVSEICGCLPEQGYSLATADRILWGTLFNVHLTVSKRGKLKSILSLLNTYCMFYLFFAA